MSVSDDLRRGVSWPWRQWISRPWLDLACLIVVVGVHLILFKTGVANPMLNEIPLGNRPGLYGTTAFVVSLIGTLGSLSVGQYLGARGYRMRRLKEQFSGELARTWKGIFYGCIGASALLLAAYGYDSRYTNQTNDTLGNSVGTWLFEAAVVLALLRLLRLVALFGQLVELMVMDETDSLDRPEIGLNPDFFADLETSNR